MDQNPALVQTAPPSKQGAAPLILIHDGGGTTFSYHCLKSLHRTVYAIHNPRFYSGRVWAGGITAMAKVYVEMIRSVVPSGGSLILGGKLPVPPLQADSVERLGSAQTLCEPGTMRTPPFFLSRKLVVCPLAKSCERATSRLTFLEGGHSAASYPSKSPAS